MGQPAFLKEGLVAYYPFNGNANDESGNDNNGAILRAQLSPNRFNEKGLSYYFDGNSSISMGDIKVLDSVNKFSGSVWFNLSEIPNDWVTIITDGSYADENGWGVLVMRDLVLVRSGNLNWDNIAPFKWEPNRWYQISLVLNASTISVYVNGSNIGQSVCNNTNIKYNTARPFSVGVGLAIANYASAYPLNRGSIDDIRIYNRALSDTEVKALYDYESQPQPKSPSIATATAQVVNGFVVGTTISDAGYGYVSNPVITITGGGGTGAKATALQVDGVVTSITITNPGSGYSSTPTITIASPPFPPKKATATSQVVNGFVVGTKITDGGFGYDSPPAVLLVGGGGSGATAVATVENGTVTAINITNPGSGYTSAPHIRVASPPFTPKLSIDVTRVRVRLEVVLGRKYQIESSADLQVWTKAGDAFVAQDEILQQDFDVDISGRYFRINQVP